MSYSYIIPCRLSTSDRISNFKFHLDWIYNICNISVDELIIAEHDIDSVVEDFNTTYKFNHIMLKNNNPFEKCKLWNMAVDSASNEKLLMCDLDTIIQPQLIKLLIDGLNSNDVMTVDKALFLTESLKNNLMKIQSESEFQELTDKFESCKGHLTTFGGAVFSITKSAYYKMGGFDENFTGWGWEDVEFHERCLKKLKCNRIKGNVYHMYHSKNDKFNNKNNSILLHSIRLNGGSNT